MDKRYSDITNAIEQQAPAFIEYIRRFVLGEKSFRQLEYISNQTKVYVFSGVIRNYLLGESVSRDFDIVVSDFSQIRLPFAQLKELRFKKNSFGGLKIGLPATQGMPNISIDIWDIRHTWSFVNNATLKQTPEVLVSTAFFNFSAIVYDMSNRKFIYADDFVDFYKHREIDVVNETNPNPALCIVNSLYYALELGLPIKQRLCEWIVNHYNDTMDFIGAQLAHFNRIIFSQSVINAFYRICWSILPQLKAYDGRRSLMLSMEKSNNL